MRPAVHYALYQLRLARAETQTTAAERDCIARHAQGLGVAAEIGVWHGVTTCRIASELHPAGVVYAVDNYRPGRFGFNYQERIAYRETRRFSDRIRFVLASSQVASVRLGEKLGSTFEFVFIDGDHSYRGIETDWRSWSVLLAPGGVIALHDSRSTPSRPIGNAGSVLFTREVILEDPRFELLDQVDSLSVLRRR